MEIDELDRAILEMLQRDGRRPFTSIGTALGVSESVVRYRTHRMTTGGVMQIAAVANPLMVGYSLVFMISVSVRAGAVREVARTLEGFDEVTWLAITAGGDDPILAEVLFHDTAHFREFVFERLHGIDGVLGTSERMLMDIRKTNYGWGFSHEVEPAEPS